MSRGTGDGHAAGLKRHGDDAYGLLGLLVFTIIAINILGGCGCLFCSIFGCMLFFDLKIKM